MIAMIAAAAAPFTATAVAAPSAHLTVPGWTALHALDSSGALTNASPSDCTGFATGSRDAEARGVVGLCADNVEINLWTNRFAAACGAFASTGVDAFLDAAGSTVKAHCANDFAGISSDYSALAAWDRWFASRLGPGACQAGFAADTPSEAAAATLAAGLAADLRADSGSARLTSDGRRWTGLSNQLVEVAFSTEPDFRACKP